MKASCTWPFADDDHTRFSSEQSLFIVRCIRERRHEILELSAIRAASGCETRERAWTQIAERFRAKFGKGVSVVKLKDHFKYVRSKTINLLRKKERYEEDGEDSTEIRKIEDKLRALGEMGEIMIDLYKGTSTVEGRTPIGSPTSVPRVEDRILELLGTYSTERVNIMPLKRELSEEQDEIQEQLPVKKPRRDDEDDYYYKCMLLQFGILQETKRMYERQTELFNGLLGVVGTIVGRLEQFEHRLALYDGGNTEKNEESTQE